MARPWVTYSGGQHACDKGDAVTHSEDSNGSASIENRDMAKAAFGHTVERSDHLIMQSRHTGPSVMTLLMGVAERSSGSRATRRRTSRSVKMPTRAPWSTTRTQPMLCRFMSRWPLLSESKGIP